MAKTSISEDIHALHVAHGNSKHCNFCNCQCELCKKEGWKYRPVPYEKEPSRFKVGAELTVVESSDHLMEGDRVIYQGDGQFQVITGRNTGGLVTFFANSKCNHLFRPVN